MKIMGSKYFKILMAFSILLGIIPLIILGTFTYFKSSEVIQNKVDQENLQVMVQTQTQIEDELKAVGDYYVIYANSQKVNSYLESNITYKDYNDVKTIQQALSGIQSLSTLVRSAYFVNKQMNWMIGTGGIDSIDDMVDKNQLYNFMSSNKSSTWMCNQQDSNLLKIEQTAEQFDPLDNIDFVVKVPLNASNPSGVIIVNLLKYKFENLVNQGNNAGDMLILDQNYQILMNNDKSDFNLQKSIVPFIDQLKTHAASIGFYKTKVNGKEIGITYARSNYTGWIYVLPHPIKDLTVDSRAIGWVISVICLIIALCILIASFFGSRFIYNPIRKIYEIIHNIDTPDSKKSNDEFEYIGEGINTLVKSKTKMTEQIKNQFLQLEELFLIKLINGELRKDEIDVKLNAFRYKKIWDKLCIVLIQIDSLEGSEFVEDDRDLVMFVIDNMVSELIGEDSRFRPTITNKGLAVLIGGDYEKPEDFKNYIFSCVTLIQEKVKQYMKIGISMGISRPFDSLNKTQIAYKESIEALLCSIRLGSQTIIYFEDAQPQMRIRQPYPKKLEDELIDAINEGDANRANSLLAQILDEILKENLSSNEYQVCLMRLLINITGVLQDSGESLDILFKNKSMPFDELNKLRNTCEIKRWFKNTVIDPIVVLLEQRRGSQYKNIMEQIIKIIHEEYDTDLSIETCAARLNYHPSYIWRILRKEMNTSFSDYLSAYRLDVAKKWLEQTDITVTEIAERLRYNNSQNFIRYFKKQESVTPIQYRQNYRANLSGDMGRLLEKQSNDYHM